MTNSPETKSPAEVAEAIVERFNIDSCDWTDYPTRELIAAITTALENERERCAKICEGLVTFSPKHEQFAPEDKFALCGWCEALETAATAIRGK